MSETDASIKPQKPGYKTTEFWVTLILVAAGVILLVRGQHTIGAALLGAAGVSYSGSRAIVKK